MQEVLITFIIPAYNAAPYVKACIESVFTLDLQGYGREVIVVNDGSTDATTEVLEQCRSEHPALISIEQENLGPSMARNIAMDRAQGKYICFVDADDRLDCECDTTSLLSAINDDGIDIIGINTRQTDLTGRTAPYRRYVPIYNKVYAPAREFMRGRNIFPCAVANLYRRAFLEEEHLRFMPSVYHEDDDFTTRAFALAHTFIALDMDMYVRLLREGSITTTNDRQMQKRKLRDVMKIMTGLDAFAAEDAERQCCMERKMDYLAIDALRILLRQKHEKAFQKEIIRSLKATGRFPLHWRWEIKHMAFNLFTRLYFLGM